MLIRQVLSFPPLSFKRIKTIEKASKKQTLSLNSVENVNLTMLLSLSKQLVPISSFYSSRIPALDAEWPFVAFVGCASYNTYIRYPNTIDYSFIRGNLGSWHYVVLRM